LSFYILWLFPKFIIVLQLYCVSIFCDYFPLYNYILTLLLIFYFYFILLFLHLLTCIDIIWATPACPSFWAEPIPSLVLQFCWRENIKDNKKSIAFLLVWDKGSYTEAFLVLFPYMCISTHIGSSLPDFFTTSCWLCYLCVTLSIITKF
jgi:hypothetical protein